MTAIPAAAPAPIPENPLDPDQRAAAEATAASVLVLAGPGTGKTTTLVGRYLHLLDGGAVPLRIFVSTFTARAADEMRFRIQARLEETGQAPDPEQFRRLPIATLHGMAARLLGRNPPPGCPPFRIFDERASARIVARHRLYLSDENKKPLDVFGAYKDRLMDPAAALAEAKAKNDTDLLEAAQKYAAYQRALAEEGGFDFGDLIMALVAAMEAHPDYRARIAGFFDHLLIDEYQDINPAQERMLRLLRSGGARLWAVGDDDQCLYAWRSADPAYILDFERAWPDPALYRLGRNYRSTATIVRAAGALIRGNRKRHAKEQVPHNPSRLALTIAGLDDDLDEAAYVLRVVRGLAGRGMPWHEMAVLYRAGHVGSRIQITLAEAGIPVVVRGSGEFWQLAPVRLVVGMIRLLLDPRDLDARALLGHGKRVDKLMEQAPDKVDAAAPWPALCRQVGRLVSSTARPPGEEGVQWRDLCFTAADLAAECDGLAAFLRLMEEQRRSLRDAEAGGDAVVLSTIHGAKGLEWSAVVVAGCEADLMPHDSSPDLEEERRLMYVAATRAKRWLVLSFAAERRKRAAPSPYLAELLAGLDPDQIRFHDAASEARLRQPPPRPEAAKSSGGKRPELALPKVRRPRRRRLRTPAES
ncbi:DNA helicase [Paramagnetospirillum marisnigri]|uniref:DNA 3'-5' helicase n=1 Tax=Paramagnetospirillum marisnigri TaxID=1285242 RepID=A0A178MFL2_9PROT|nr:ATP-dependent helicase [Paramagnetospirillum marisnigri]OAN46694.1 DNA helicase [Paramagnetospirillum marisnigri]